MKERGRRTRVQFMAEARGQSSWRRKFHQTSNDCKPRMKPIVGAVPFVGQTVEQQRGNRENPNRRRQLALETDNRRGKELGTYLKLSNVT